MRYHSLRIGMSIVCIFFLLSLQTEDARGSHDTVYIAGFVLDEEGRGILNANIIITHEGEKLFSLRSTQAGWFESIRALPGGYVGKEIRLTVLKTDFDLVQKSFMLKKIDNLIVIKLQPLNASIFPPDELLATGVIYGYVHDLVDPRPLPGAKISLAVGQKEIAVGYSRESGYVTLNYDTKYFDRLATYTVTHEDFEQYDGKIELRQQNKPIPIGLLLKQSYWFITSYPLKLPITKPATDTKIRIYGRNQNNYSQVSAKWKKKDKQALIGSDLWKLELPSLKINEYDDLSFVFITRIGGLEEIQQNAILNAFGEVCEDYLGSEDDISAEKIKKVLENIVAEISGYKLLENGAETLPILQKVISDIRQFNSRIRDRILVINQIKENIKKVEISKEETQNPLSYKQHLFGVGVTGLFPTRASTLDAFWSWFPAKTSELESSFRSRFSIDFGYGIVTLLDPPEEIGDSSQGGVEDKFTQILSVRRSQILFSGHFRLGMSYRFPIGANQIQAQLGVSVLNGNFLPLLGGDDIFTDFYFGVGIPVKYF